MISECAELTIEAYAKTPYCIQSQFGKRIDTNSSRRREGAYKEVRDQAPTQKCEVDMCLLINDSALIRGRYLRRVTLQIPRYFFFL